LAAPRTKEEALQYMRFTWFAFIVSIVLYVWIGETMPGFSWLNFAKAGEIFVILGVFNLLSFLWARRKLYSPALEVIQSQPENVRAVRRWMSSWIVLLCIAQSETLFGLAFRMGDKTLQQSLPFYVVGSVLTLWLWPRQVWSSTKIAAQ
jgi:hypothetical protein